MFHNFKSMSILAVAGCIYLLNIASAGWPMLQS